MIQTRTGLRLSTFFSAAKIAWMPENIPDARERDKKENGAWGVCDSDALFGTTDLGGLLPKPVPIHACVGDSHAVMFSHGCVHRGDVMCACRRGRCKAVRSIGRTWNGAGRTSDALSAVCHRGSWRSLSRHNRSAFPLSCISDARRRRYCRARAFMRTLKF